MQREINSIASQRNTDSVAQLENEPQSANSFVTSSIVNANKFRHVERNAGTQLERESALSKSEATL